MDFPEFRSLFYYRVGKNSIPLRIAGFIRRNWRYSLITWDAIGPGFYLEHSFSTIISARSIGKNCQINQQVTIGHTEKGSPTIGDNVRIFAGAIVFGNTPSATTPLSAQGHLSISPCLQIVDGRGKSHRSLNEVIGAE